jgi:hypothetical protein
LRQAAAVIGVEVVGDPAAQCHVERLGASMDAAVVVGGPKHDDVDVDVDPREIANDDCGDQGLGWVIADEKGSCAAVVSDQLLGGSDVGF